jgi:hypothetical protein
LLIAYLVSNGLDEKVAKEVSELVQILKEKVGAENIPILFEESDTEALK